LDAHAFFSYVRGMPRYLRDVGRYRELQGSGASFPFRWSHAKPLTQDFYTEAGVAGGHYFYQDLWAARRIFDHRPDRHVDIGSRIDGFVAHVLTFMPVEVI